MASVKIHDVFHPISIRLDTLEELVAFLDIVRVVGSTKTIADFFPKDSIALAFKLTSAIEYQRGY